MRAFYNEIDASCCDWLSNLMDAGHITPGAICDKSIEDVFPDELRGFDRCHFFAGIGGWDYALNLAGWGERPVWTGSAPCQPFSQAGAGAGFADERHLWPFWHWLIAQCSPAKIFGEQVASKNVEPWIDLVFTDLEATGYACGTNPFPSASVGAPHIRDRAYFVADADYTRPQGRRRVRERSTERAARPGGVAGIVADPERIEVRCSGHGGDADAPREIRGEVQEQRFRPDTGTGGRLSVELMADANISAGVQGRAIDGRRDSRGNAIAWARLGRDGMPDELADTDGGRRQQFESLGKDSRVQPTSNESTQCIGESGNQRTGADGDEAAGSTNGFWRAADWLLCRDEKWRPVEPGTFPLVDGLPAGMGKLSPEQRRLAELAGLDAASLKRAKAYRVGTLRGYGNAINPHQAAEFIRAAREAIEQ